MNISEIGGTGGDFRVGVELTDQLVFGHVRGGHCPGMFGPKMFEQALGSLALEFELTQLGLEPLIGKARRWARFCRGRGDRRPAKIPEGACDHVDASPVLGQVSSQVELALELERPEHRLADGLVPLVEPPGDERLAIRTRGVGGVVLAVLKVLLLQALEVRVQLVAGLGD